MRGNMENNLIAEYGIWVFLFFIKATNTTVTVTAIDGTGIVQQQPLTLGCNYSKGDSDLILDFSWRRGNVIILSGSVSAQTVRFQSGTDWTTSGVFLGDYVSSLTIQLPVSSVTPSAAGQYTCVVSSLTGRAQDTATAEIYYIPIMGSTFPSSRTIKEFSHLQIDCSNYTTPGNPPMTSFTWTYQESTVSSGAVLDIKTIGRDRRGQYTCTASNTAGSSNANVTVDVQFPPKIESNFPSNRDVTEFSNLKMDCNKYTTPGNPLTTNFIWAYAGITISSGSVLDINNIGRDRRGQYTCTAGNPVGSSNANVSLDVQYLDRPTLSLDKNEVVENETVSLTCNVESNPTAVLVIRNVDKDTVLIERKTNRLQFTIDRVQCLHNWTLFCTARNTQTGDMSTSARKGLNMRCKPSILDKHSSRSVVNQRLGEVASLTVYVAANPSPRFDWYVVENKHLLPIPNSTEHNILSSKQASILQVHLNNTREYGTYAVLVINNVGKLQVTFKVPPDSPDDCLQTPDRLGLGVGIGISVMIPVIIIFISTWVLLHRRQARPSKNTESGTNELPMRQGSAAGEQRTYDNLARASSTVNEYEQLQIQEGSSKTYQNL